MKKIKILCIFITFILCVPLHYVYDILPIDAVVPFVPVNESIWEHMKLIFTSFILCTIMESFLYKSNKINVNNSYIQALFCPIIGIIIYLIIFIPLYNIFGENLFISLFLLFLVIIIEHFISYYLYESMIIKNEKIIGIIGIVFVYFIFTLLTYYPINKNIFYDELNQHYGIKKNELNSSFIKIS